MAQKKINGLLIPQLLVDSLADGNLRQPDSDAVKDVAPFLDVPILLFGSMEALEFHNQTSYKLCGEYPFDCIEEDNYWEAVRAELINLRMIRGTEVVGPVQFPWLDLDRAIQIGHHCEMGDDHWVYLDYRSALHEPVVVASDWSNGFIEWCQIEKSFERFAKRVGSL